MLKALRALFVALLVAVGGLTAAAPAQAAVQLGGLDLHAYCKRKLGGTHTFAENLYPRTAYTWVCWYGNQTAWYLPVKFWGPSGMNLNEACRWRYGAGAYAKTTNPSNPYSWRCYR